jgi:hypothetical protein
MSTIHAITKHFHLQTDQHFLKQRTPLFNGYYIHDLFQCMGATLAFSVDRIGFVVFCCFVTCSYDLEDAGRFPLS